MPRDALEAARVDGATEWQVFRRVTVPLLATGAVVVLVTLMINVLKIFDLVFVIAPPSSQHDANVLALQMYQVSFGGGTTRGWAARSACCFPARRPGDGRSTSGGSGRSDDGDTPPDRPRALPA